MKVRKWIKFFILCCTFFIVIHGIEPLPRLPSGGPCEDLRPGDCDPDACNGEENSCEARYTRFWDPTVKGDRQRRSCQCAEESICNVIGMHSFSGCRSYMSLGSHGQKFIREWTMSPAEKQKRRQYLVNVALNRTTPPFMIDKIRHAQLQNGNTRFCCKTSKKRRRYIAAAQINGINNKKSTDFYSNFCFVGIFSIISFRAII